jgi:DNA-binding response OmpR family regulator
MSKKILIIEDEEDLLKMMIFRLKSADYEVISAVDGLQGLEMAKKEKPNLIILDLMLPRLDGFRVCKMLKASDEYKDIPIIILTARMDESDKKLAEDVGANAYMTKPFNHQLLLGKIKELLKE